jgi:hypothetical protein
MRLELDDTEAEELRMLLTGALADLSHEIADTDNASYRKNLRARRDALESVRSRLG